MKFMGYKRSDSQVGVRNHTLVVASARGAANLAILIGNTIPARRFFVAPNENGRDADDRATPLSANFLIISWLQAAQPCSLKQPK